MLQSNGRVLSYSSDAGLNQSLGQLGSILGQALGSYQNRQEQRKNTSALEQALSALPTDASSIDVLKSVVGSGIPMNTAVELFKAYKPQQASQNKPDDKLISLQRAKNTIGLYKDLLEKGNVGTDFGFAINPRRNIGQKGEDRAKLEKYGQSLINSVANGLVVRNQKEFDKFSNIITNPDSTTSQLKGAIDAIDDMVSNELELRSGNEMPNQTQEQQVQNLKFDIQGARAAGYTDQEIKAFLESNMRA